MIASAQMSALRPCGYLQVEVYRDGKLWRVDCQKNLVVAAGRNLLRDFLARDDVTGLTHMAIGTGTAAPAATDTKLANEVYRDTFTQVTKIDGGLELRMYLPSSAANGLTITEAGLFGGGATAAKDSGTLYSRVLLSSSIAKNANTAVIFTWTITWS